MSTTPITSSTQPPPVPPQPLTAEQELPILQFAIGRFDHYFDSVNNKANFWLAFNTFLLGGVVAAYKDLVMPLGTCPAAFLLSVLMTGFILVNLVSTGFILWASLPFLSSPSPKADRSALYYVDVKTWAKPEWTSYLDTFDEAKHRDDHRNQAYALAGGLSAKYKRLWIAGCLMVLQLVVLLVLLVVFIGKTCPKAPEAPARPQHVIIDTPVRATIAPIQPLRVIVERPATSSSSGARATGKH